MKNLLSITLLSIIISSCSITKPVSATSNPIGSKVGKSSGTCYFKVICMDVDASIVTAAQNGGITKISTVDYRQKNILGVIQKHECIVTGE
jgi:hypothetical protein